MTSFDTVHAHYSESDNVQFNNPAHFENFLNYLFRTDKAQKNTNELTKNCVEFVVNDEKIHEPAIGIPFGSLDERKVRRQNGRKKIGDLTEAISGKKTSPFNYFNTRIIYFEVKDDNDQVITRELNKEDMNQVMVKIIENLHSEKDKLYIAHLDQDDDYHIHVVSLID